MLPFHNTRIEHWNPGASNPLVLPVHLLCNTSDEELFANIRANVKDSRGEWRKAQRLVPTHNGIALLCGSGPSLADTLEDIRQRQNDGATVFALNGAAKYLYDNGILPDYQVIIDAREQTAELIGPARVHMFASQVHPKCFELQPNARLWHLQIEGIDPILEGYPAGYCMVGGAASVGNTATCLAYAMGFRDLHCYGYDSCHRDDKSHAFDQPMNAGEPCAHIDFAGKTYLASLTMKLQAEKFQETGRALIAAGASVHVHGSGLLPDMWNTPENLTEQEKYERMWLFPEYRAVAPGEGCVELFTKLLPGPASVIDFGCGTGRAGLKLSTLGYDVTLMDFAGNSRDPEALLMPFVLHDLTKPVEQRARYGFCTDVMEHIPPGDVETVISNMARAVDALFLQISLVDDVCGGLIGHPLHLTVKPAEWWVEVLKRHGTVEFAVQSDAKDVLVAVITNAGRDKNA